MLKRLQIRHFRGFNDLDIAQLSDINLIAGENNSGKTSLLEALFLLAGAGNADPALNPHVIRGLASNAVPTGEPFWKEIFSNLDVDNPIEIESEDTAYGTMSLTIISQRQPSTTISPGRDDRFVEMNVPGVPSLILRYSGGDSTEPVESHVRMTPEGIEPTYPLPLLFSSIILLPGFGNIHEDAKRLGMLRVRKQGTVLVDALKIIEPRLQGLEDNSSSGTPMIWGDIGWPELVPLSIMGNGMTQVARLILAIASVPNGIVLIDEIESGLHHSVLPDIWTAVDVAARQYNTQIFATTHSRECVTASHEFLKSGRFRLHRLETIGETNRCVTYEPETADAAIRHGFEVR